MPIVVPEFKPGATPKTSQVTTPGIIVPAFDANGTTVVATSSKQKKNSAKQVNANKFLKGAVNFAGNVIKETASSFARLGAAVPTIVTEPLKAPLMGTGLGRALYKDQSKTTTKLGDYAFRRKEGKAGFGSLETGLDALLTTFTLGTYTVGKSVATSTGKQTLKSLAKQTAKVAAKDAIIDAPAGGLYGILATLQEDKNATPKQIIESALIGAGIATVAPTALAGAGKATLFGAKVLGKKGTEAVGFAGARILPTLSELFDVSNDVLTQRLAKATRELEDIMVKETEFLVRKPKSLIDAKDAAIRQIEWFGKAREMLPKLSRAVVDSKEALERFTKEATKKLGFKTDYRSLVHRAPFIGAEKARKIIEEELTPITSVYGKDLDLLEAYADTMNKRDRLLLGQVVEGGETAELLNRRMDEIRRLAQEAGFGFEDGVNSLKSGQQGLQRIFEKVLRGAVDSGRIRIEEYNAFRKAHPNYLPNYVKDFIDNPTEFLASKRGIVADTSFKASKGSTRELLDTTESIVRYINEQMVKNENNKVLVKVMNDIADADMDDFMVERVTTADQMLERLEILKELKRSKPVQRALQKMVQTFKAPIAKLQKSVAKLQREGLDIALKAEKDVPTQADIIARVSEKYRNRLKGRERELGALIKDVASISKKAVKEATKSDTKRGGDFITIDDGLQEFVDAMFRVDSKDLGKLKRMLATREVWERNIVNDIEKLKRQVSFEEGLEDFMRQFIILPSKTIAMIQEKTAVRDAKLKELFNDLKPITASLDLVNQKRISEYQRLQELKIKKEKTIDLQKKGLVPITVREEGVETIYNVQKDLAEAIKGLTPREIGGLERWLDSTWGDFLFVKPAGALRAVTTRYNPLFLIRNPVRDIQTAVQNSKMTLTDWGQAFGAGIALAVAKKTGKEPIAIARQLQKTIDDGLSVGAFGSGFLRSDVETSRIKELVKLASGEKESIYSKALKLPLKPFELIDTAGQFMEDTTRRAVFARTLKDTGDLDFAAKIAREATIDFNRSGSVVRVLNKITPFLNARIQGTSSMVRSFNRDPQGFSRKLLYTAMYPSLVLITHNTKYESYYNIPEWERQLFWIVMTGEETGRDEKGKPIQIPLYLKIPKGESLIAPSAIIERTMTLSEQAYPKETSEFIFDLIGSVSPIGGGDAGGTISGLLPLTLRLPAELIANHSYFLNKDIESDWIYVPELGKSVKREELDPGKRQTYSTSQVANTLGLLLNYSPSKIDYIIEQGLVKDMLSGVDLLLTEKETKRFKDKRKMPDDNFMFKLSTLPFLRGVFGSSYYGQDQAKKRFEQSKVRDKNSETILKFLQRRKSQ